MNPTPTLNVPTTERQMRIDLIVEELDELQTALDEEDIIEVADALADLLYVVAGAGLVFGIDLDAVLQEVHRSNMSKLHHVTGQPIYREDGKVLKGANFSEPDIAKVLRKQIEDHHFANRTITNLDAGTILPGTISADSITGGTITINNDGLVQVGELAREIKSELEKKPGRHRKQPHSTSEVKKGKIVSQSLTDEYGNIISLLHKHVIAPQENGTDGKWNLRDMV
jgi:phosphoribosyl-ATP pyrophosphohydrolase